MKHAREESEERRWVRRGCPPPRDTRHVVIPVNTGCRGPTGLGVGERGPKQARRARCTCSRARGRAGASRLSSCAGWNLLSERKEGRGERRSLSSQDPRIPFLTYVTSPNEPTSYTENDTVEGKGKMEQAVRPFLSSPSLGVHKPKGEW